VSRLLIIDGHAYAYRAFHAIRSLRSPSGQPTNAIYGFVKMLEKMRLAVQPTHLMVVWDGGLSAERMAALPEYKAQRPEMPVELQPQFDEIRSYLTAAGLADFCGDGVEADDYIGCLARQAEKAGWYVIIASSDKDFMQLVSAKIGLFNPNDKTGMIWGREQVHAKAGVEPEQIVDWLALMGDAVDNIHGVRGIGPKTATELLKQFGSAAAIFSRLTEVKSERIRMALQEAVAIVQKNRELVRLHEVACEFLPEKMKPQPVDREKLRGLFRQWGFKGLLAELDGAGAVQQSELI
jgi:DNA polymerase-1